MYYERQKHATLGPGEQGMIHTPLYTVSYITYKIAWPEFHR